MAVINTAKKGNQCWVRLRSWSHTSNRSPDFPFLGVLRTEIITSGPTVPGPLCYHSFILFKIICWAPTEYWVLCQAMSTQEWTSQIYRPCLPELVVSVGAKSLCSPSFCSPKCNPTLLLCQLPEKRIRCTENKRGTEQVYFKFLVR